MPVIMPNDPGIFTQQKPDRNPTRLYPGRNTPLCLTIDAPEFSAQIRAATEEVTFDQTFDAAGTLQGGANLSLPAKPLVGRQ